MKLFKIFKRILKFHEAFLDQIDDKRNGPDKAFEMWLGVGCRTDSGEKNECKQMINFMYHTSKKNKPRFKQPESTFMIIIGIYYYYIKY